MNRYCNNQFLSMHSLNEQILCMETKPTINQHISDPFVSSSSIFSSSPVHEFDKKRFNSTINRSLYEQTVVNNSRFQEDQSLRIHVGNIPFLWTIDDLCKQFLVFGPIKDPEIVMNERGSKGFGFITFLRHNDGINAIRVKNGSIADGRKITVALASSRSSNRMNICHCHCCHVNNNCIP